MKITIPFSTLLILSAILIQPSSAQMTLVKAYYCESTCVAVNSQAYQVFLLGGVDSNAMGSKPEVFKKMRENCLKRAARIGLIGILADHIVWAASDDSENYHEVENNSSSTHSSTMNHSSATTVKKIKPWKVKGISYQGQKNVSRYDEASNSYQSVDSIKNAHSINVDLSPASTNSSCNEDPDYNPNQIPYEGDLPLQG